MPDVDLSFGGDGSPLKKAWQLGAEGCAEFITEVKKIVGASNAADAAQKQLGDTANRWLKQMETPLDSHLRRMGELQTVLQAGRISQNDYAKGIALSVAQMREAEAAADTLGQTAKRVLAEQQSPQDQFNAKLAQFTELKTANKLTEEQFAKAVDRATAAMQGQDVELQSLLRHAASIRAAMVTPQEQYADRIARAKNALSAELITETLFAAECQAATEALDAQNEELQKLIALGARIKAALVTPLQDYNNKLKEYKQALDAGTISQREHSRIVSKLKSDYEAAHGASSKFGRDSKSGADASTTSLRGMVSTVAALGGSYTVLQKVVQATAAANKQFSDDVTRTFRTLAEQELKLQIQAGLTPEQVKDTMPVIQSELKATPSTDLAGAIKLQTQAASSGFNEKDVKSGAALKTVLEIKAATNQFGEGMGDEKEAVLALSQFLKGMGKDSPAAKDIHQLGGELVSLFATSDIQFSSLKQLAPEVSNLRGFGLKQQEMLAAASVLVDVMGDEKAATGLRNVVTRTATAAKSKERTEAFKEMGLKPEDVDMAIGGDQFIPTLEKISQKLKGMKPEAQNRLLSKILGDEGQSAGSVLFDPEKIKLIKTRIKDASDQTLFKQGVKSFQESGYADRQRREIDTQVAQRDTAIRQGTSHQDVREEGRKVRAQMEAKGIRGAGAPQAVGEGIFGAGEMIGMTPEETAQWISFMSGSQERSWGGFVTGHKAAPVLPKHLRGNDLSEPIEDAQPLPAAIQQPAAAAGPVAIVELGPESKAALKDNTDAIKKGTAKPPVVIKKAMNQPTKTPASTGVQTGT
jgi:hypothetical protein